MNGKREWQKMSQRIRQQSGYLQKSLWVPKNTDEKKNRYTFRLLQVHQVKRPALSVRRALLKKAARNQLFVSWLKHSSYDPLGSCQSTVASQLYWLLVSSEDVANAIVAVAMKMIHCSCFDFVRSIEYQLIVTLDLGELQSNQVLVSLVYSKYCIT